MKWIVAVGCVLLLTVLPAPCVAQAGNTSGALPGRVVDVKAGEFYFMAPDTIPAGLTTFRLQQAGLVVERVRAGAKGGALVSDQGNPTRGLHMLWVVRLEQGKTVRDLYQAKLDSEPTVWAENLGGPGFSLPPSTTNATLILEPGNYALICHVGAATGDRMRHHLLNGMFRALTVLPTSRTVAPVPAPDVVARITGEGTVELSTPLVTGRQIIRVENATLKDREFKIQQIPAGRAGKDWLARGGGDPGTPWGGLGSVPPGSALTTTIDFEPGEYVLATWSSLRHATSRVVLVAARQR